MTDRDLNDSQSEPNGASPPDASLPDREITDDRQTTVDMLRRMVHQFVAERDWRKFHSPKNLSMALAVEAAELMEQFQWVSTDESRHPEPERRHNVTEELADILCYALAIANELEIDVASAMKNKMIKNRAKYPVETFKGFYGQDDVNLKQSGN